MKQIYCCECGKKVDARLTDGKEIYPHRSDLYSLPFWICNTCHNFVGCHYKTKDRIRPLGCIPNKQIKDARSKIHALLDPMWQEHKISRKKLYAIISDKIGRNYHTGNIRTIEEAREFYRIGLEIRKGLNHDGN